jgi:hypothetical protein
MNFYKVLISKNEILMKKVENKNKKIVIIFHKCTKSVKITHCVAFKSMTSQEMTQKSLCKILLSDNLYKFE